MRRDEGAAAVDEADEADAADTAGTAGTAGTADANGTPDAGSASPDAGARWPARLAVQASLDERGTRAQHTHVGPLRLLKTLHPEGPKIAHAVLVHPPGGLVGGDLLDIDVEVGAGAHLLVTHPGATRFYRSAAGVAAQRVTARVADGARLEWLPQETLAYAGCDALNAWQARLEGSGSLMAMEVLALGLAAAAAPFTAGRFEQRLAIEGLWREHGVIDGGDRALLDGPCGLAGHRVLGTLVLAAGEAFAPPRLEAMLEATRSAIAEATATATATATAAATAAPTTPAGATPLLAGVSAVHGRVLVLRVLAHGVEPALHLVRRLRRLWRREAWGIEGADPRLWAL